MALPRTTVALPALPAARLARSGRPASEPAAGLPRGLFGFRFFPRLVPPSRCAGFCAAAGEGDVRRELPIAGFFQMPFTGSATSVAFEVMVPIPLGTSTAACTAPPAQSSMRVLRNDSIDAPARHDTER
ncbi:hypothetical protein OG568_56675 (plasmid) [Streptomyces sp. NBC_01450]|uniref:hypothetical protein n=1 Tax=Streptomyces sp. NBC_01450 TaxID=2903871 RepID=UPI002E360636|nr:hypothetical protein [Streptomyces sp. NBC_01450]